MGRRAAETELVGTETDIVGEELWESYRPKLIVFARGFGSRCALHAEDLAHDVIAIALSNRDRFDGRHSLSTWLYSLARNRCIDLERKESRRETILRRTGAQIIANHPAMPGPDATFTRTAEAEAVAAAIATLSPTDRQIAFLRHYEELPVAEVAEVMSMPVGTVKYRLHSIRRNLRGKLREWECTNG